MALLLVFQVLIAAQLAITVPGLGMARGARGGRERRGGLQLIPGPSGTATRLRMLRSWGFYTDDFARSWLFTSRLTNLIGARHADFAVVIVARRATISTGDRRAGGDRPGGVASSGSSGLVRMLRSETFARRVGTLTGRAARWARGVGHRRPSDQDFAEAAVGFRDDLRTDLVGARRPVMAAVVGSTY